LSTGQRYLGIDTGRVRIGLAISDPQGRIASPLATYERRTLEADAAFLRNIVKENHIGRLVIGLPVHLDGREGEKAAEARRFGAWLAEQTGLPVTYWDERFTSVEAEAALQSAGLTSKRRKARRDRVAAQIMLQSFLDAGAPLSPSPASPLDDRP
jgi:putative Holliday junction resolvase